MASKDYEVVATASFSADLSDSINYYLENAGKRSARRFLDDYDSFLHLVAGIPGHGSPIVDTTLRWRKIGAFIAVYDVDGETRTVTLLRLYHMASNWHSHTYGITRETES